MFETFRIYEYGSEKLFLECSAKVVDSLNIKITEAHIDTTSFHSDGKSTIQDECGFYLALGTVVIIDRI